MERYICPVLDKKICPYKDVESFYADKRCDKCTIPEVYMGIRPNVPESHCEAARIKIDGKEYPVPESHCEAGKHMPYDTEMKPMHPEVLTEIDRLYKYMMKHSKVFQSLGMDQQGEFMVELKKVLDKWNMIG